MGWGERVWILRYYSPMGKSASPRISNTTVVVPISCLQLQVFQSVATEVDLSSGELLHAASLREVVGHLKVGARGSFFYCFCLFTEDTQVTAQVSPSPSLSLSSLSPSLSLPLSLPLFLPLPLPLSLSLSLVKLGFYKMFKRNFIPESYLIKLSRDWIGQVDQSTKFTR